MAITASNKEADKTVINSGDCFNVKLSLTAEPEGGQQQKPKDIILLLDRSQSMTGTPFTEMIKGAKKFISLMDASTGTADENLSPNRITFIDFGTDARVNLSLIYDTKQLEFGLDKIKVEGSTNHGDAFTKARNLFDQNSDREKIVIMFTDGETNVGPDPARIAERLKSEGIIIYGLGYLPDASSVVSDNLKKWSSDPDSHYVFATRDVQQIVKQFEDAANAIINAPGATGIRITEQVNPDFRIKRIVSAGKGTAVITGTDTLDWNIDVLGAAASETASLEFEVEHLGNTTGLLDVNKVISYTDNEGNEPPFPDPAVTVNDNSIVVVPEECPQPVTINMNGCQDSVVFDMGDVNMESLGRILQVDVTVKNVCPGKRVALAVILDEVDVNGAEHDRGLKTVVVPAHTSAGCHDVTVKCIKFVLPESIDVSGGSTNSICNTRHLKARAIAHYIDNNFECCQA